MATFNNFWQLLATDGNFWQPLLLLSSFFLFLLFLLLSEFLWFVYWVLEALLCLFSFRPPWLTLDILARLLVAFVRFVLPCP